MLLLEIAVLLQTWPEQPLAGTPVTFAFLKESLAATIAQYFEEYKELLRGEAFTREPRHMKDNEARQQAPGCGDLIAEEIHVASLA